MAHARRTLTLEDQVFGIAEEEAPTETSTTEGNHSGAHRSVVARPQDRVACLMVPTLGCVVLIAVVLWSLSKSVQYTELFAGSRRYTYGLWTMNVAVIVLTVLVVCWSRNPGKVND